jgi:hypothetical protein
MDNNPSTVKSEVDRLFRAAVEERNRQWKARKREEKEKMSEVEVLDPAIEEFVQEVVNTDEFAKLYFERLREAANGEFRPIVRMVVKFSERTGVEKSLLQVLAERYLEVSRDTLGAPKDEELWKRVVAEVKGALAA